MLGKPGVPFADICDKMMTYDLLLFRGDSTISNAIAAVEAAYVGVKDFTHVGMVIRPNDLPRESRLWVDDPKSVYVFESTASGNFVDGVPSVVDHKGHLGVQLRDLRLVVNSYDVSPNSRLAWMPLQDAHRPPPDPLMLQREIDEYMFRAYDTSFVDMAAVASPMMRIIRDNWAFRKIRSGLCWAFCCGACPNSWLFCSELCAQIYKDVGVFPQTVVPADVMPVDFLPVETTPLLTPRSPEEPISGRTVDADGQVPWVFRTLVRFTM